MNKVEKEMMKRLDYREDFDFDNKFHLTDYIDDYYISTVDLGLDHSFGIGEPLYYETMVFKKGSWSDLYCERYSTEEEARKGHKWVIEQMKQGTLELWSEENE